MLQDIIILGAGGQMPDIADLIESLNCVKPRFRLKGILDDNPELMGGSVAGLPVLGPIALAAKMPKVLLVNSILSPEGLVHRPKHRALINAEEERWPILVHPSSIISPRARLSPGVAVLANATVCAGASLGCSVTLLPGAVVSHSCQIGEDSVLASGAVMNGGSRTGHLCYLGAGCIIRENVSLGHSSVVGMGSIVLQDVLPETVVAGNPARPL